MNTETLGWRKGVGVLLLFAISFATQGVPSVATSLAAQEQPVRRTVAGFGVFPTLPVVAAAADGKTPALYIIAGDTATWLLTFEGMHLDHDQVIAQLSPDGQNIAYLLLGSWEGSSSLGVVDIEGNRQIFLDKGAGALASEKGAAHEKITSFAWMNNEHILYSKVTSPSTEEAYASWETGRELPARGEIWLTDLVGAEQQCVAEVPVKKILGIASDEESIYFTCSPVQEEESYSGESFCALDITSGRMRVLWPLPSDSIQSSPARNYFDSYTLLSMPNGTQKVLFVGTEFRDGAPTSPPDVWMGDPKTGEAAIIWTAIEGAVQEGVEFYDVPVDFLGSPLAEEKFVYLADGGALGGIWLVNRDTHQNRMVSGPANGLSLLVWTSEGLVVQKRDAVQLLAENGQVQGEILFESIPLDSPSNAIVNWDVPYLHQRWDTPDWFHGGWACGPTSAVMALSYFNRLTPHPIAVHAPGECTHTSDYGWYVPNQYTFRSACSGDHTFNRAQEDPNGTLAWGAYGATTDNGVAYAWRLYQYAEQHDVGYWYWSSIDEDSIRAELNGGAVVILGTGLTGAGHIVIVRGYTEDGRYIVNDPKGDKSSGVWDECDTNCNNIDCGREVLYTWSQLDPGYAIALYGPEHLTEIRRDSNWDGMISIHNGAVDGWPADVDVCFKKTNGSAAGLWGGTIPGHGTQDIMVSSVLGSPYYGSAVVRRYGTEVSTVVVNTKSDKAYDYTAVPSSLVGTEIYVPAYFCSYYGWSSFLYVQNSGGTATSTTVHAYSYNSSGGAPVLERTATANARGRVYFNLCTSGAPQTGSVRITADQPLTAVVIHQHATMDFFAYGGTNQAGLEGSLPSLMKNYYGWTSSYEILETTGNSTSGYVDYYPGDWHDFSLNGRGREEVYLGAETAFDDGLGSGKVVTVWGSRQVITAIHHAHSSGMAIGYLGFKSGSSKLSLPRLRKDVGGWNSSLTIQNAGSNTTSVRVFFFNPNGTQRGTVYGPVDLGIGNSIVLYTELPSYWSGSVEILSSEPNVVAVVHEAHSGVYHVGYGSVPYGRITE